MGFQDIQIKREYRSFRTDIVKQFYIPLLGQTKEYRRAVGFFSSSALLEISLGLTELVKNNGRIKLIASPKLNQEDVEAICAGLERRKKEELIEQRLLDSFEEPKDAFEEERLNILANLVAKEILEIKIAICPEGIYHEKIGLLEDENHDVVAFSGSSNETYSAMRSNYETIDVFCSWTADKERVQDKLMGFQNLWNNQEPGLEVQEFPQAVKNKILQYQKSDMDFEIDEKEYATDQNQEMKKNRKEDLLKDYQNQAIDEWEKNNYRGIYDMATGTGKTYTALGSMCRLFRKLDNDCIAFVVCPQVHLVEQWAEDLCDWGFQTIVAYSTSAMKDWKERLLRGYRRIKMKKKPLVCVTTNITFQNECIQEIVYHASAQNKCLLVIDEVHNFGAKKLSNYLDKRIPYRLGLSATVERYRDKEGTEQLLSYFEKKCIEYSLEQAIKDGVLVSYYYYPVLVYLTEDEIAEYKRISKLIAKNIEVKDKKIKLTEMGEMLLYKRARLVAGAENKIEKLREKMTPYKDEKYILVYCGATKNRADDSGGNEMVKQIEKVGKMLGLDLNMRIHKFTAEEDRETRLRIKRAFAEGEYQAITAIKCLDEGVNIPEVDKAFILASSRNPREFIQRRGRLLRQAPQTGKKHSIIYDFVTLPKPLQNVHVSDYEEDKALVQGELARIEEFGKHALNSSVADTLMNQIKDAYGIDLIQIEDYMEEEYYE